MKYLITLVSPQKTDKHLQFTFFTKLILVLQSCKWHKWYEKQFHHFWIFQDWYCLILEWIYMTTKMLLNFLRVFTQHRIPSNSWILHSKNTLLLSESHPLEHFCANTMMWKSITESLNCSSDIYRVGAGVCCWVDIPIYCCWHSYPFHLLFYPSYWPFTSIQGFALLYHF